MPQADTIRLCFYWRCGYPNHDARRPLHVYADGSSPSGSSSMIISPSSMVSPSYKRQQCTKVGYGDEQQFDVHQKSEKIHCCAISQTSLAQ
jgi:hypothetical protein